ncbi:class I SAM-dependent methyltransferase [Actinosynnema mirum]|uniref:O-methyltransferase domain protein n=1 Tax=Actinosynnema mirum (strain ATCC 29888 / DSM 43827 / JCM 3225 / NBRC 14064 / NCIMB 13271 / NRRL B-12336 / IMRU 3971 / 101) TaxID=446462 RepID=C6WGR3_ACTMD|nr:class I SAM-dependent methyltransferase [Actinosynnema mirum]ACU34379.1 O-methyltransferase domain protein [Actinosynnema mirum DSM 43827]
MDRVRVALTGAQETMLATLYGRALDSARPHSVLNDGAAAEAVARLDYDFPGTGLTMTSAVGVAIRAWQLDRWLRGFLAEHPRATVLHLACGLDTRAHRLSPGPDVRWVDVDLPDVVAVREKVLPPPGGDYRLVGASATSPELWESIPDDRPTAVVFEGLSMYLSGAEVEGMVRRAVGRFPSGELMFDVYGTIGIRLQKLVPPVRRAGAVLRWGLDDPTGPEAWGLKLVESVRSTEMPMLDRLPLAGRVQLRIVGLIPRLRDAGRAVRYRFPA